MALKRRVFSKQSKYLKKKKLFFACSKLTDFIGILEKADLGPDRTLGKNRTLDPREKTDPFYLAEKTDPSTYGSLDLKKDNL